MTEEVWLREDQEEGAATCPNCPPESKSEEALGSALGSVDEALPALGFLYLKPCGWAPQCPAQGLAGCQHVLLN